MSKVPAESKVSKYIRGIDANEMRGVKADEDVSQYFLEKMEINKSMEKIFLNKSLSRRDNFDEN